MKKILILKAFLLIASVTVSTFVSFAEAAREMTEAEREKQILKLPIPPRFKSKKFRSIFDPVKKCQKEKNHSRTIEECQKLIKNYPADIDILMLSNFCLGIARVNLEDYDGAVHAYKNALANIPSDVDGYGIYEGGLQRYLASVYITMGKYDIALPMLIQLIKENPDSPELAQFAMKAIQMLGECFPDEKDSEKHKQILEDLWAKNREKGIGENILFEIALWHEEHTDYETAIKKYQEQIDSFPKAGHLTHKAKEHINSCQKRLKEKAKEAEEKKNKDVRD